MKSLEKLVLANCCIVRLKHWGSSRMSSLMRISDSDILHTIIPLEVYLHFFIPKARRNYCEQWSIGNDLYFITLLTLPWSFRGVDIKKHGLSVSVLTGMLSPKGMLIIKLLLPLIFTSYSFYFFLNLKIVSRLMSVNSNFLYKSSREELSE